MRNTQQQNTELSRSTMIPSTTTWLASFTPSMNFTAVISIVIASLYLSGVLQSYSKCGNQGACTIFNEKFNRCEDKMCLSWTIIVIAVSVLWILSRFQSVHDWLLRMSDQGTGSLLLVHLPLFAVSLTLFVTAIFSTTKISGDDIVPETGVSSEHSGGGNAAVLWLLWALWTASMMSQGKVEHVLGKIRRRM